MRPLLALLVIATLALVNPSAAHARGWRARMQAAAASRPTPAQNPQAAKAIYPKYNAGFHARYLENVGVPTGDVGLRGNGITWNPW
jgi:hypothetical protein